MRYIFFIGLVLTFFNSFAQFENEYGKVYKQKGYSVRFNLATMDQIKFGETQDGVIELKVEFCDPDNKYGWELYLSTKSETHFTPGYGSDNVPVSDIRVTSISNDLGRTVCDDQALNASTDLLIGSGQIAATLCQDDIIYLSFTCEGMQEFNDDHYFLDLDVELKSTTTPTVIP